MLAVLPLFLLLRGWAWKTLRGWLVAIVFAVASLVPVAAYANWFHERTGHYGTTMSAGFYLWGRVSSFADCARIKPTGDEATVCPTTPIVDRTPPGNFVWHAPQMHADMDYARRPGQLTRATQVLTDFAINAVEAQPLDYLKTVFFNTMMSFGFPRIAYPGAGTTYYYSFHLHYVTAKYNLLPPDNPDHEWIPGGTAYQDWLSYGHQAPGVVHKVVADPDPGVPAGGVHLRPAARADLPGRPRRLLSVCGGAAGSLKSVRLHWAPRGTTMLPWVTAVALLVWPRSRSPTSTTAT